MISELIKYLVIQRNKHLKDGGLESAVFMYLQNKYFGFSESIIVTQELQDEDKLAVFGYTDTAENTTEEIKELMGQVLGKQEIKPGMHYSSNPLLLGGIYLASLKIGDQTSIQLLAKMIQEKLEGFDSFSKFLLCTISDKDIQVNLQVDLSEESVNSLLAIFILKKEFPHLVSVEEIKVKELINDRLGVLLTTNLSFKDIFLLEYFLQTSIKKSFEYNQHTARTLIRQILHGFNDAVEKIKGARRKDHVTFLINDEYDVQDLLYVILKPIFPDLTVEDYVPKHGGTNKRIDLVIPSENIVIEVKIVRKTDSSGKFIDELNVDISNYYKHPNTKVLFGFVYDPLHKITDLHPFNQLDGKRSHDDIKYEVEIIVNPH